MVWIHVQFFKLLMLKERNCCLKNTSEIVKNLFEQIQCGEVVGLLRCGRVELA
jgi:hypothetical protein